MSYASKDGVGGQSNASPWSIVLACAALSVSSCGPRTMEVRLRYAERLSEEAASALDEARKAADAVEPTALERALAEAEKALNSPEINLYPDAGLQRDQYRELAARIPVVRKERERRDVEKRIGIAREKLGPSLAALDRVADGFSLATVTQSSLETLEERALDVKKRLEAEKELFEMNKDFGQWARSQREKAEKALEGAAKGKRALAFLQGPAAALQDGLDLHKEARAKKAPKDRVPVLTKAKGRLHACERDATAAAADAALAGVAFAVSGGKHTPAQAARRCKAEAEAVENDLKVAAAMAKKSSRKRP